MRQIRLLACTLSLLLATARGWSTPNCHSFFFKNPAKAQLFDRLQRQGTPLDHKIFEVFSQIQTSTDTSNYHSEYVDLYRGQRPSSTLFQGQHWSWSAIQDYFFKDPLPIPVLREQDLRYLTQVLKVAKSSEEPRPLQSVLESADHEWAIENLKTQPNLLFQYQQYVQGKSHAQLLTGVHQRIELWVNQALDQHQKMQRQRETDNAIRLFSQGTSKLDLFLLDYYFSLSLYFEHHQAHKFPTDLSKSISMVDWKVFNRTLSEGTLEAIADFLFQNSHDIQIKSYLLQVLNQVNANKEQTARAGFRSSFLQAHLTLDALLPRVPAPDAFKTDFYIYAASNASTEFQKVYKMVRVRWNSILGKPEVTVPEIYNYPQISNATVSRHPQLADAIRVYFENFRQSPTYKQHEAEIEKLELNTRLKDVTYFVEALPQKSLMPMSPTQHTQRDIVSIVRLFDATQTPSFIERELQSTLPGRETLKEGEVLLEIGRLLGGPMIKGNKADVILPRVADYLRASQLQGFVYLDCTEAALRLYQRMGFTQVTVRDNRPTDKSTTPLWVMRMSIDQFVMKFSSSSYSSVPLADGGLKSKNPH